MKRITATDFIMLGAAIASLVFAEIAWFRGEQNAAIFVGLWVPSILGFANYLKLMKGNNR